MISRRQDWWSAARPPSNFKLHWHGDEHQWSSTLVVVARGNSVLTILGMTYADNDLIQIQET